MELLNVNNLNIEFTDYDVPERVVKNFNLTLNEGEIVGIVGESGSGKSMTAMTIAGLTRRRDMEASGEILFEGKDILHMSRKELRTYQGDEISMVFQEPMTSLNPVKRIGWQLEEPLRIHHPEMSKEERRAKAIKYLELVELDEPQKVYKSYPHQLSGGMRQRVMIATAMIGEPKLLLADEPTTALDVTVQLQIVKLLQKINKENNTAILFISHDLSLVKKLCSRVIVMCKGDIVEEGNTHDIFHHPKHEYTKNLINAIPKLKKMEDVYE